MLSMSRGGAIDLGGKAIEPGGKATGGGPGVCKGVPGGAGFIRTVPPSALMAFASVNKAKSRASLSTASKRAMGGAPRERSSISWRCWAIAPHPRACDALKS